MSSNTLASSQSIASTTREGTSCALSPSPSTGAVLMCAPAAIRACVCWSSLRLRKPPTTPSLALSIQLASVIARTVSVCALISAVPCTATLAEVLPSST